MAKNVSIKRALIASVLVICLSFASLIGTTFAWFTDSVTSSGNKIMSGSLKVDLELLDKDGSWSSIKEDKTALFNNENWEPGYTEVKMLKVENEGTLALKWKAKFVAEDELGILADVIDVYVRPYDVLTEEQANNVTYPATRDIEAEGYTKVGTVRDFVNTIETTTTGKLKAGEAAYLGIALKMQESAGNEYQDKDLGAFDIMILAAQLSSEEDSFGKDYDANAEYQRFVDVWDGTADTSWYNDTDTEFKLTKSTQLAGLSKLVDDGNTFAGKTIILQADMDLYVVDENGNRVCFDPIGDASNADFSGTFDGNGKTIYNLYQDCNSKHLGLFGAVYEGTVKNLTLDGATVENDGTGYASGIAAYAGAANFENITLKNSTVVNYNHNTGGIVGWCSNNGTTTTFDGINIESSTNIGSWWGSYDTRVGGVVGAMNTGNYVVIKNSTIACRLDVYNDACSNYQWFNYRTAGMIIADVRDNQTVDGRTEAHPVRVTCENVEVIFGDWANYHYCESASYGTPSYADEGEYKFQRVEAGLGYGGVDLSACNHAADETHNELIKFDFLFGARDGKGIYGISEFDGVTVTYE